MTEPSAARRGFDLLLARHPGFDVVSAEWQEDGPWLLVTLGIFGEGHWARYPWAIWKSTGAVHGVHDGAVTDDPVMTP